MLRITCYDDGLEWLRAMHEPSMQRTRRLVMTSAMAVGHGRRPLALCPWYCVLRIYVICLRASCCDLPASMLLWFACEHVVMISACEWLPAMKQALSSLCGGHMMRPTHYAANTSCCNHGPRVAVGQLGSMQRIHVITSILQLPPATGRRPRLCHASLCRSSHRRPGIMPLLHGPAQLARPVHAAHHSPARTI